MQTFSSGRLNPCAPPLGSRTTCSKTTTVTRSCVRDLGRRSCCTGPLPKLEKFDLHTPVRVLNRADKGAKTHDRVTFTDGVLDTYDAMLHAVELQGPNADSVHEVCIDGHEKVLMKTLCGCGKRGGQPIKKKTRSLNNYSNGWFMAVNPADGRVLGVEAVLKPEDNDVKVKVPLAHFAEPSQRRLSGVRPQLLVHREGEDAARAEAAPLLHAGPLSCILATPPSACARPSTSGGCASACAG